MSPEPSKATNLPPYRLFIQEFGKDQKHTHTHGCHYQLTPLLHNQNEKRIYFLLCKKTVKSINTARRRRLRKKGLSK